MEDFWGWAIGLTVFAAWLTHIIFCLNNSLWGILIAGAVMFPIGIIHGFMIWF